MRALRRWILYRQTLNVLLRDIEHRGYQVSPATYDRLRRQAIEMTSRQLPPRVTRCRRRG